MLLTVATDTAHVDPDLDPGDDVAEVRVFHPDPVEPPHTRPCGIHHVDRWRAGCDNCTRYHLAINLALAAATDAREHRAQVAALPDAA